MEMRHYEQRRVLQLETCTTHTYTPGNCWGVGELVHGEVFRDTKFKKRRLGVDISTFLLNLNSNLVQKLEKAG
jgi:hypothetical protein